MNLLVSACLLGCACRYDGGAKPCAAVRTLAAKHTLIPVCPEIYGGLPTPRTPCELVGDRVLAMDGADRTDAYRRGAAETLHLAETLGCRAALLNLCIVVQTYFHIFLYDRELEFDGFQPLSVRLPFLKDMDFGDQRLHKLSAFLFIHHGVQLIKVNQNFVDIIGSQLFSFDCHFLCSGFNQQRLRILDFIIHLVKTIIKVCLAFDVMFIIGVKCINFLYQSGLDGIALAKLFFVVCNLLFDSGSIHFHADFLLHQSGKLRIADQLGNHLCDSGFQEFFVDLLLIVALVTTGHGAVFAAVVVEILVLRAVCLVLDTLIAVHTGSADRAFEQACQQMHLVILTMVDLLVFLCLGNQFHLCIMPEFFGNKCFVQTIDQQIVVLFNKTVIVSCAMHLFRPASAIGDLAAVNRIFQYPADKRRIKQRILAVLSLDFSNAMIGEVSGKTVCAHVGMHVLVKDDADCFCFFLIHIQLAFFKRISIRSKAAVPFALTGFLDSALHRLNTDILTLDLGNR